MDMRSLEQELFKDQWRDPWRVNAILDRIKIRADVQFRYFGTPRSSSNNRMIDFYYVYHPVKELAAHYTVELADDLRAVHGFDAETMLTDILVADRLAAELRADIDRDAIATIYGQRR